jgi:hypothetical protein
MRYHHPIRRVTLGALALLTMLTVVAPVQARDPVRKIEPRRTVPYRVNRPFTPDTDVVSVSGYAAWMIDEVLAATTPLPKLGAAFMRAERAEGINARYLVAHAMLESGWGTSAIATRKRNLFGYNAYDRDPWKYAKRFPSHARGVATVAEILRRVYLTPGGRRWYGFTTLRAINRYYASAPRWADKVAVVANDIDYLIVTLRERGLRFGRPDLVADPIVGVPATLEIRWSANPGAELPAALRFAVRWSPLAVVEASPGAPGEAPAAPWQPARRVEGPGQVVRLAFDPPATPGVWRLDVAARDSDGHPLPKSDRPRIRPLAVRVVAPGEVGIALSIGDDGGLVAAVSVAGAPEEPAAEVAATGSTLAGSTTIDVAPAGNVAAPAGEPTPADGAAVASKPALTASATAGPTLEVWTLPLDPTVMAYMTLLPLPATLGPTAPWTVPLGEPAVPAVVVARVVGDPSFALRARPAVVLTGRDAEGRLTISLLPVASPRDAALLGRASAPAPITLGSLDEPGSIDLGVSAPDPPPAVPAAVASVEEIPGPHAVLVRTISVDPGSPAAPSDALVEIPEGVDGPARLSLSGLPAGIRLVMAGLVPRDGGPVDPATVSIAWISVAAAPQTPAAPN